jgi:hypothetical protein
MKPTKSLGRTAVERVAGDGFSDVKNLASEILADADRRQ